MSEEVTLTINDVEVKVAKGTTVYQAIKKLGLDVPIFCYHDRMNPFGACRVCLVEVDKMGKLQTSCTLTAAEGMVVHTESARAEEGRKSILELLLINHPLDCPICDRGGECPLQEQTLKYGPGESRFFEEKRHFTKALPVGPVLMLDRERCIACARCTRFGSDVAGDHALELIDRGYRTEVGPADGKELKSKFIGNTIMICPVGALTSQVYRFRARPWDNLATPSSCTLCPVGCSLYLDSRDGQIMRTRSRENPEINDIWLCDKGWFGYEFTSSNERLQSPLIKKNGQLVEASWDEALAFTAEKIAKSKGKAGAIGGSPLTLEENFLFQEIMRKGAHTNNIDYRVEGPFYSLQEEGLPPGMHVEPQAIDEMKSVYLLGLDLTEEFPVLWLRLKKAIDNGCKVVYLGHYGLEVSRYLSKTVLHQPGDELEAIKEHVKDKDAHIFIGRQYLNTLNRNELLSTLSGYGKNLHIMEGRGNSLGARFAGVHPELGPNGEKLTNPGLNTRQQIEAASKGELDLLYIAGADPASFFEKDLWKKAVEKTDCVIVQDLFLTKTALLADVVLPTLSYVEKRGSFMTISKTLSTLQPGKEVPLHLFSDAEIFLRLIDLLHLKIADFKLKIRESVFVKGKETPLKAVQDGKLKVSFFRPLFDGAVRMQKNPHLSELAKQKSVRMNFEDAERLGLKGSSALVLGEKLKMDLSISDDVAKGTLLLPLGFESYFLAELFSSFINGLDAPSLKAEGGHVN